MTIVGFIVVRCPEFNYLIKGRDSVPRIGDLYYSGIDRQRWVDVFDEDYYANRVPENVRALAAALIHNRRDFTGVDVCQETEVASKLLEYSNRNRKTNELIAVRSDALAELKGVIQVDCAVNWIGYDILATGEWSLIAEGVFRNPKYYSPWVPMLNRFGLLDDYALLPKYVADYESAMAAGQSEPTAPKSAGLGVFFVEIGIVCEI